MFKTQPTVKLTVFNHAELYRGAFLSSNVAKNLRIIEEFVKKLEIVPFSTDDSIIYAKIYAELKKSGEFIGDLDEMIASIVIREDETLYTRNVKHYEKIPSLKFVNWEEI
jgi:predicted nucleic acid-binding protein